MGVPHETAKQYLVFPPEQQGRRAGSQQNDVLPGRSEAADDLKEVGAKPVTVVSMVKGYSWLMVELAQFGANSTLVWFRWFRLNGPLVRPS